MAFGGYCGFHVDLNKIKHTTCVDNIEILFAEECGWVLEVDVKYIDEVLLELDIPAYVIGRTSTYGNQSRVWLIKLFYLVFKNILNTYYDLTIKYLQYI